MAPTYTSDQVDNSVRKAINPGQYSSYLLDGEDYTTQTILADTPTMIAIPTTIKFIKDWERVEVNPGQIAIRYIGSETRRFSLNVTSGMQASINNPIVHIDVYKGITGDLGASVSEPGVSIVRKVGTGSDTGALAIAGTFDIDPQGYLEVYATMSLEGTLTLIETSINIMEVN